ncbi:TetR/AcrR family transcriptional regulator [Nocardioides sp. GXZ039]|uniref:TetR/AcrR family transcriptional regulator n=1 Tax=Nocardioides sp. GXZ039 TaxID=3136018 RepID=UPI0030F418F3
MGRGRRPGSPDTRATILHAARARFAEHGYAGTSVRRVAADAGVDSALVHHYFGSKDDLFLAALDVAVDPRTVVAPLAEGDPGDVGARLVRTFVSVWDEETTRTPLLALVRGAIDPAGARLVRDAFGRMVLGPLVEALGVDQPERRLPLVASQLVGLVMVRYVLELEPLASASAEELVASLGPTVQRYLLDPLP